MNQTITSAIVLSRTNYQEADRILTLLTPNHGKISVLAKGVRRSKSKMAGGVELFSVSEIGFIRGKGALHTLTSARLLKHYENIVKDIERTMLGYELTKLLNKTTEDAPEIEYFDLLDEAFVTLNQADIKIDLIKLWFYAQLLRISGHSPNLRFDTAGNKLEKELNYEFDFDEMTFKQHAHGTLNANQIKLLRLVLSGNSPKILQKIQGVDKLVTPCLNVLATILPSHIRT